MIEGDSLDIIARWKRELPRQKALRHKRVAALKRYKARELDQRAAELHRETFGQLSCLDCANCCKSIPPIVNRTDAQRLARHLSMSEAEFYARYLREDEDGDTVINSSPCPFLESDHRCRVYDQRPRACRAFPHTDSEFHRHMDLHLRNTAYCPAVHRVLERLCGV